MAQVFPHLTGLCALPITAFDADAIAAGADVVIIGGGDTVDAIDELGMQDEFSFVSTGGGAMLDYLADGSLPGLDALNRQ